LYNSSIELSNERTRPTIRLTGRAEKILADRKVRVSISHLPDYATAIVVIEDQVRVRVGISPQSHKGLDGHPQITQM
jgi:hypothetical protein